MPTSTTSVVEEEEPATLADSRTVPQPSIVEDLNNTRQGVCFSEHKSLFLSREGSKQQSDQKGSQWWYVCEPDAESTWQVSPSVKKRIRQLIPNVINI